MARGDRGPTGRRKPLTECVGRTEHDPEWQHGFQQVRAFATFVGAVSSYGMSVVRTFRTLAQFALRSASLDRSTKDLFGAAWY